MSCSKTIRILVIVACGVFVRSLAAPVTLSKDMRKILYRATIVNGLLRMRYACKSAFDNDGEMNDAVNLPQEIYEELTSFPELQSLAEFFPDNQVSIDDYEVCVYNIINQQPVADALAQCLKAVTSMQALTDDMYISISKQSTVRQKIENATNVKIDMHSADSVAILLRICQIISLMRNFLQFSPQENAASDIMADSWQRAVAQQQFFRMFSENSNDIVTLLTCLKHRTEETHITIQKFIFDVSPLCAKYIEEHVEDVAATDQFVCTIEEIVQQFLHDAMPHHLQRTLCSKIGYVAPWIN